MASGASESEAVLAAKQKLRKLEWFMLVIVAALATAVELFYFGIVGVPARDCILEWLFVMIVSVLLIHFSFRHIQRLQDKLTLEQQQARRYLDVAGVILGVIDADGKVSLINRKGCEILEYEEKDIVGEDYYNTFVPERMRDDLRRGLEELMTGKSTPAELSFESPVLTRSGEERLIAWHYTVVLNEAAKATGILVSGEDITERRKAEQALRASHERYRDLVENIADVIYAVTGDGVATYVSPVVESLLGYRPSEIIGRSFAEFMYQEDLPRAMEAFLRVIAGEVTTNEYRLVTKSGQIRWVRASNRPILEGNSVVGVHGVLTDITERKQAEEALSQSEERYRTILEEVEDSYFEVDLAGSFTFVNDSICRTLGYSREELIGMNYRDYSAERDVEAVYRAFNKVYRTGKPVEGFSWELIRKDGSAGIGEAAVLPLRNHEGEVIGFRGVGRDVTKRRQAEEALRQSEERYRTILEEMEDDYFEVDLAGNFTFVNDSLCRTLGYSRRELIGMNYRTYTAAKDREGVYRAFNNVYRTGRPVKGFSRELIRKDGRTGFHELSAFPVRNQQGEIMGFRGVGRDITERRAVEQQLLMSSRLASVGELAAGVAHELNNPLTGIMGYAQLLATRQNVAEDIKADLDRVYSESQRAAKIVQNLLSFARRHTPQKDNLDVNELLQRTLELRNYELRTSNIGVRVNLAPDLPHVMADYHQIQQVLLNIIINAEQAIAQTKRRGKIIVATDKVSRRIRISIGDNGCGISQDEVDKVFDPFFTTKEVGSGTGLGLSVCHGIITQHGGNIYIESQKGRGTRFLIELPLVAKGEPAVEEKQPVVSTSRPRGQKTIGRILIVDDEPVICDVLARALSEKGYQTDSAANAKTALTKIAENGYEVCIIDVKMPQTSGKELYEMMKQRYPSSAEKVVFMTGDTVTPATEDFLASTGKPHLAKPFNSNEVIELVEETLGGRP